MSDLPNKELDDLRLFVLSLLNEVSFELASGQSVKWDIDYVLRCENDE